MSTRDLGASVRQRLLNQAKAQFRPFQEVMQYYAMERFLYRLARSPHTDEFILKGALLLSAWRSPLSRSTMDIDLLGKTSNKLDHIRSIFSNICVVDVEPDGISFDPASLETTRIKEDADYEGVRVHFNGILARARISMQIDIGFGDVVIPEITTIEYPTMLEFPVPVSKRAAPAPFTDKIDKVHKPANASGEPSGHSRFQSHRSSASSFRGVPIPGFSCSCPMAESRLCMWFRPLSFWTLRV